MHSLTKKELSVLPSHNIFFTKDDCKTLIINKDIRLITSKPVKTPFAFDSIVLSVNAKFNKGAALLLQCAVKTDKEWSAFYNIAYISNEYKKSFSLNKDAFAHVDTDTILPVKPANYFKFKITVLGKADVFGAAAALTNAAASYDAEFATDSLEEQPAQVELKPISQYQYADKKLQGRLCSPASLAMVLNYWGKKTNLEEAAKGVYDNNADIYGNWTLNTAYAAQRGLRAFVLRCSSLAQAEGEILCGRPLIASIAYKTGKLKGGAVKETKGHIVVICGFDEEGNIIVADPAAKDAASVKRIYGRKEFALAWLKNKKGLAYAIGE